MRRLLVPLAASAALTGCAGEDDRFAERASAICAEKQAQVEKIPRPGALILFEDYLKKALPILREQRTEVEALDGADSDEAQEMLEAWRDVLAALENMQEGARSGSDIGIAIPLRRAAAAEREADEAARAAGVDACAGFNPITPD